MFTSLSINTWFWIFFFPEPNRLFEYVSATPLIRHRNRAALEWHLQFRNIKWEKAKSYKGVSCFKTGNECWWPDGQNKDVRNVSIKQIVRTVQLQHCHNWSHAKGTNILTANLGARVGGTKKTKPKPAADSSYKLQSQSFQPLGVTIAHVPGGPAELHCHFGSLVNCMFSLMISTSHCTLTWSCGEGGSRKETPQCLMNDPGIFRLVWRCHQWK